MTAQKTREDSIKLLLQTEKSDTTKCNLLNELIELEADDNIWPLYNEQLQSICEKQLGKYEENTKLYNFYLKHFGAALNNKGYLANIQSDIPAALNYFQRGLEIDQKLDNKKGIATSLNNLGSIYQNQGQIEKAIEYFSTGLAIAEKVNALVEIAQSLNNLGLAYDWQANTPKALHYYHKALKIYANINDKKSMAITLNNLGLIYKAQGDTLRALRFYQQSLKIREEINDPYGVAIALHSIAHIYYTQNKFSKALETFEKSLKILESLGNKSGMAHCFSSMAGVFDKQGDKARALEYWNRALKIREELNDQQAISMSLNNLAYAYYTSGDLTRAKSYAERSLAVAQPLGFPGDLLTISGTLHNIYGKSGDWKKAYQMLELHTKMNDSINTIADRKEALQTSFQYEYEKKTATDSIKAVEERKVFDAKLQQQKTQKTALYFGIGLITLFAFFMFNRFRVTQKQKRVIEFKEKETQLQKYVIEQKHKEISDSINYAERIQRSFLATKELLETQLQEYFILYQPKDIVSGDFYWAARLRNGNFALAVADSTGHGVPGAIMSLLNITSIEKACEDNTDPAAILNQTRKTIISRLSKDGSQEGGKDGMDCSLLVFDNSQGRLYLAAANNPIWIVRSSLTENECIETGFDSMPVGKHDRDTSSFTTYTVELQKGDMIYALTDGFADQFGGPRGKKYMHKKLKELLVSIAAKKAAEQKEILVKTLKDWRGELEQVDDITIVGIRVT